MVATNVGWAVLHLFCKVRPGADDAARWHALLLQLEMYAASGQYVETKADIRRSDYEALLAP